MLLRYKDATEYLTGLGVTIAEQTLRKYVSAGRLPVSRIGGHTYLAQETLDAWIASSRVPATRPFTTLSGVGEISL